MKTFTIVTFKSGLVNLWIASLLITLTDRTSTLSDIGAFLGAGGIVLLGLAILGTLACGVRALITD